MEEAPSMARGVAGPARGIRRIVAGVIVLAIVLIGYGAVGFAYAESRISSGDATLNTVVSHQNQLNTTFHGIDAKFNTLSSGAAFNPTQARSVIDEFIANSQAAGKTVDQDDASLIVASKNLHQLRWLTLTSRGGIDKESVRISHARNALADARTVAADYVLDGEFLQSFMDSLVDLGSLTGQVSAADYTAAKSILATMKTHVDRATQLSSGPGLPSDLHSLMVDFQSLVADYGKFVDAAQAGDDTGIAANQQAVQNDASKIGGYNFDQMSTAIDQFYKPLVDGFNSEMAAATA